MSDGLFGRLRKELGSMHAYSAVEVDAQVKLDANENPYALPAEVVSDVITRLSATAWHRYPDPRALELRSAVAEYASADPDELVLGSGSDELIAMLSTAFSNAPEGRARAAVVYPDPTFVMYGITARGHGLSAVAVPLDSTFNLDVEAMAIAIERESANLVFLATPNNPTGNAFDLQGVEALATRAPDTLFVLDEAYGAYCATSANPLFGRLPNVALLGTLSKIGLAALRVGWVRLPRTLAHELEKVRQPYNLNSLSQQAAALVLSNHRNVLDEHVARVVAERRRVAAALVAAPDVHVYPSDANFVLVRTAAAAERIAQRMADGGVSVRGFSAGHPRLASHLRITIGTAAENDRMLEAFREALNSNP